MQILRTATLGLRSLGLSGGHTFVFKPDLLFEIAHWLSPQGATAVPTGERRKPALEASCVPYWARYKDCMTTKYLGLSFAPNVGAGRVKHVFAFGRIHKTSKPSSSGHAVNITVALFRESMRWRGSHKVVIAYTASLHASSGMYTFCFCRGASSNQKRPLDFLRTLG